MEKHTVQPTELNGAALRETTESQSRFRRVNNWLHLWLGLISGIVVFIVCITGCIWVFNSEILWLLEPEKRVQYRDHPVLTPSQIANVAKQAAPGEKLQFAYYHQGSAIEIGVGNWDSIRQEIHVNPYTGHVVSQEKFSPTEADFFTIILFGHRMLWLPENIGRPIVNYSTLIFVVLLITGLIWWYPKKWNRTSRQKSFKIKWGASFKRVNLDLHNVLGFYAMLVLLCIALTGMTWGIAWFSEGLYWVTTGKSLPSWQEAQSDSVQMNRHYAPMEAMDKGWAQVVTNHPKAEGFYYAYPDTTDAKSGITFIVYPSASQFYNSQTYKFDRHTAKELPPDELYGSEFEKASFGVKLRKMNYDIHVGSILGFPGKVLAFFASLIGASLPITGFFIWWNRKFKETKKKKLGKNNSHNAQAKALSRAKVKAPVLSELDG